eukprot:TRINITY_DN239_c0_g1_i2.p1 TRINITY_DN239_c0_g1~~TRINITY_DN239_c0_g1_i2.p1  ORF type:complete len:201 (-),score=42.94 TRINITY_DN239_c0_g1_i2:28-630(-)
MTQSFFIFGILLVKKTMYNPSLFSDSGKSHTLHQILSSNQYFHQSCMTNLSKYQDRLRPLSYPGADLILLCFSTAHKPSLESIKIKWFPEIRHHIPKVPYFLVGTKLDLKEELQSNPNPDFELVKTEEGQALANDLKALKYIEISAKTRKNLDHLFQEAVGTVLQNNHVAAGSSAEVVSTPVDHDLKGSAKPHKKDCVVM